MHKISFLGNYTIDLIAQNFKKKNNVLISNYNQYNIDIIDKNSNHNTFNPEFTILLLDGDVLLKNFKNFFHIKKHIHSLIDAFMSNQKGYFVMNNICFKDSVSDIQSYNSKYNVKNIQNRVNQLLNNIAIKEDRFFVFDILSLIEKHGIIKLYDNAMWYYAKIRFNQFANDAISKNLSILINSISNKSKKCLILDLDNTLWGGIVGEDGIEGINLGVDGIGEIFYLLQQKIKQIKNKGIILAVCSKNNENDVKKVFTTHDYCYLKWNDFIVKKVNWDRKDINVKHIAKELNIGEDSIVFIDDNPLEREIVSSNTNVIVPDFPDDPSDLLDFINEIDFNYFSKLKISKEDKQKTIQYKQNIKRSQFKSESEDIDSFIKNLKVKLTISRNNPDDILRISQLTQKTNQFNLTTKRYAEIDIRKFIEDDNAEVYVGKVADKFGDYGKVIVCILEKKDKYFYIDSFLMSCRVIGRNIEGDFLATILNDLLIKGTILAHYYPTKKNILVKDEYKKIGFIEKNIDKKGNKSYYLDKKIKVSNLIEIKYE